MEGRPTVSMLAKFFLNVHCCRSRRRHCMNLLTESENASSKYLYTKQFGQIEIKQLDNYFHTAFKTNHYHGFGINRRKA